jgi:hypothetical protein
MPVNVSLLNTIQLLRSSSAYLIHNNKELASPSSHQASFLLICLTGVMALILFFSREQIFTKFDKLIFVLLLLLLAPGVTFHYYLLLLVILYLVSFDLEHTRSDGGEPNVKSYILNSNWSRKFFTLIMFLTIPCWAFPWNLVLPSALDFATNSTCRIFLDQFR